jgi:hypothetical protein
VILSLGMPRSGTTLVQKMFEQGEGYFHQKVSEFHPWHPMNGPDLVRVVNTFPHKRVLVVRTRRLHDEIVDSMRVGAEMGNPHPWDDAAVRELCARESANWLHFLVSPPVPRDRTVDCHTFSIDYRALALPGPRREALEPIASLTENPAGNLNVWLDYLREVWGRAPVNVGRLAKRLGTFDPPKEAAS